MPTKQEIIAFAVKQAAQYNVPASIVLGVIQAESSFQPEVVSFVGAIGLMQLMPSTAKGLGVDPHNWQQNIEGGTHYLSELYHEEGKDWKVALGAYNAGPGNATDAHAQAYAAKVMGAAKGYQHYDGLSGANPSAHTYTVAAWMNAYRNGYVPQAALVPIGNGSAFGQPISLRPDAAASFMAMVKAARADGVDLLSSIQNGYRSYATQQALYANRAHNGNPVAPAGQSNHGYGIAADISTGTAGWTWIKAHGSQYGWLNDVNGDVPHFDYKPNGPEQSFYASRVRSQGQSYIVQTPAGGGYLPASMGGRHVSQQELNGILSGLGLNPNAFGDLIHQAVVQQWTPAELEGALYGSTEFKTMFPGIFNADGSLKMTAAQWTQLAYGEGGYQDIARNAGIKIGRDGIGQLIGGNVSPTEFTFRARVLKLAQSSENYRQTFNQVLKASGQQPVEKGDWFHFVAGQTDPRIENMYEAVALAKDKTLSINPLEALKASHQIGEPGAPVDLKALVGQVRQVKDFVAPELNAAGISDADLAVLESGSDPKNLKGQLNNILNSRQALIGHRVTGANVPASGLFPSQKAGV